MGVLVSCEKDEIMQSQTEKKVEKQEKVGSLKSGKIYAYYNINQAVSYALSYTEQWTRCTHQTGNNRRFCSHSYNHQYKYWNNPPNTDCANFVSQVLKAGGLINDISGNGYADQWYYKNQGTSTTTDDRNSTTWQRAQELYDFLKNKYYTEEIVLTSNSLFYSNFSFFEKGAIVCSYHNDVWDSGNNQMGKITHVAIITGKTSRSAYISAHTNNNRNYSFKSYLNDEFSLNGVDKVIVLKFKK